MQRVRSASAASVAGLALVLVSACGGHGVSDTSAASTPSPAVSVPVVTPSPVGSATPTGKATEYATNTPASAERGARSLIATMNEAYASGSTSRIISLFDTECKVCLGYLRTIASASDSGGRYTKSAWHLLRVKSLGVGTADERYVRLWIRSDGLAQADRNGKVTVYERPSQGHLTYLLLLKNGRWLLREQTGAYVQGDK